MGIGGGCVRVGGSECIFFFEAKDGIRDLVRSRGLGVTEAAIVAQTIAESGACLSGASAIHINLFGPMPVVVFGTDGQKERNLPPLIRGEDR